MSTFTPNKNLELPANNADVNTWDVPMNADFTAIDKAFGGITNINAVGASGTVTLTATQYTPPIISIGGALTANVNYQFPSGVGGVWVIGNGTSGANTVTFSSGGGGTTVVVAQGFRTQIFCDGTNVGTTNNNPPVPAGSTTNLQYNSSGVLAGNSHFTFNGTNAAGVNNAGSAFFTANGSSGSDRAFAMQTSSLQRWWLDCNGDPESGSNAGSNFVIYGYNDAGSSALLTMSISRASGLLTVPYGLAAPGTAATQALNATNIFENGSVFGGGVGPGTLLFYTASQSVVLYSGSSGGNWTTNISHSAGTTLNTVMITGQVVTVTLLATQGVTPFFCNVVQVDGSTVTPKWLGGAPVAGNASGIDVYTFAVIKVGNAAFTVLASQTQFK